MVLFLFFVFGNIILPAERKRNFQKQAKKKKTLFYKLNTGPSTLRNILGPILDLYLDQLLTYNICFCPYFYSVFSTKCKVLKNHKKRKRKTLFVNTPVLLLFSKCPFFFLCIFTFAAFGIFSFFVRDVFDRLRKIKKKVWNQQKQKNDNNKKQDAKQKQNLRLWFKTKQDNKQNKQNKITSWNTKQTTNNKKQEPESDMRNRKQGRTIRTRERQRKIKWKRGRPKKAKEKQRETQKNEQQKWPFWGEKTGFFN